MLFLDSLIPMQDDLRENDQIEGMIEFVKSGGNWADEAVKRHADKNKKRLAPIYITKFPDGKLMIHDGHHRCLATYLAGRHFLYDNEYMLCEWTYEAYNAVWFDRGYVTPHDPMTEVRLPDFFIFKNEVIEMAKTDEKAAMEYIAANHDKFARPRRIWNLADLAKAYLPQAIAS